VARDGPALLKAEAKTHSNKIAHERSPTMFRASRSIGLMSLIVLASLLMVSLVPSSAFAGALGGPKVDADRAPAFDRVVYQPIYFRGGALAHVEVIGDHDTDLDVYVLDSDGDVVARDDDGSDVCLVDWVPTLTDSYTIVIVNRGRVYNAYTMGTN
jgi:hypothetical protein